jgi:hypothetical protein
MTHVNSVYAQARNPSCVMGPFAKLNFGLVLIDWSSPPVTATLQAIAEDGSVGFSHPLSVRELRNDEVGLHALSLWVA